MHLNGFGLGYGTGWGEGWGDGEIARTEYDDPLGNGFTDEFGDGHGDGDGGGYGDGYDEDVGDGEGDGYGSGDAGVESSLSLTNYTLEGLAYYVLAGVTCT